MSEMTDFQIRGDAELQGKLKQYTQNMTKDIAKAMLEFAGEIESRSVRLCPLDTGELRARSFSELVYQDEDGSCTAVVGYEKHSETYGDVNADSRGKFYSVYVHERMDLNHPIGQAKFLEQPFKEMEPQFLPYLAKVAEEVDAK